MNTTTSKRLLSLLLALITALSLCVPAWADNGSGETAAPTATIVDTVLRDTLAQEKAALTSPDFGSEWILLGMARSGYLEKGSKYFCDYYDRVVSSVDKAAQKAQAAAEALFAGGSDHSNMPTVELTEEQIAESGLRMTDLLVLAKLASSKSDARRLIEGGGVFAGDEKVADVKAALPAEKLDGDGIILRKGKKGFCKVRRA